MKIWHFAFAATYFCVVGFFLYTALSELAYLQEMLGFDHSLLRTAQSTYFWSGINIQPDTIHS